MPMKAEYQKRRDYLYEELSGMGFEIARPNGAFYILQKSKRFGSDSMAFCVDLAKKSPFGSYTRYRLRRSRRGVYTYQLCGLHGKAA